MVGSPGTIMAQPSALAAASSLEPGSVTATQRAPSLPESSQKYDRSSSGSMVEPDLEEQMKIASRGSIAFATSPTWPGSVESSTCSFGPSVVPPKTVASTSGPSEEPPMPSSTADLWPRPSSRSLTSVSCGTCSPLAAAIQPSHLPSSLPVQSVASPAARRRVHPSARMVSMRASTAF